MGNNKYKIFITSKLYFNLNSQDFQYFKENKEIKLDNEKWFLSGKNLRYLLSIKNKKKALSYANSLIESDFTCAYCKKKYSFNISPEIDKKTNKIDFSKVVCCCKKCRKNKMVVNNILKPVTKEKIDWDKINLNIEKNIKRYAIKEEYEYRELCRNIILFKSYKRINIPEKILKKIDKSLIELDLNTLAYTNSKEKKLYREKLYNSFNKLCPVCGKKILYEDFTMDHIIAKSLGGNNSIGNIIGMCFKCNSEKNNKSLLQFLIEKEISSFPILFAYIAEQQKKEVEKQLILLKIKKKEMEKK